MKTIPLTQGKESIVDDDVFEWASKHKWFFAKRYAVRNIKTPNGQRQIYLHREIANTPDHLMTDHISGDQLDNRRSNLRHCDSFGNNRNAKIRKDNKTGFKGVYFKRKQGKFVAQIAIGNGRGQRHLGYFERPEAAYEAYTKAAKEIQGEFARI